jgi:hypothetical protein
MTCPALTVGAHLIPEGTPQTERAHRVADLMSFHPGTVGPEGESEIAMAKSSAYSLAGVRAVIVE